MGASLSPHVSQHSFSLNNSDLIIDSPDDLFYELVYAFAQKSTPEDVRSEAFGRNPVGMIRTAFLGSA